MKFTEVKDKRLLKATLMEREKLIFVDNSYNVFVSGVGESLQRNCRVRLRYYWALLNFVMETSQSLIMFLGSNQFIFLTREY